MGRAGEAKSQTTSPSQVSSCTRPPAPPPALAGCGWPSAGCCGLPPIGCPAPKAMPPMPPNIRPGRRPPLPPAAWPCGAGGRFPAGRHLRQAGARCSRCERRCPSCRSGRPRSDRSGRPGYTHRKAPTVACDGRPRPGPPQGIRPVIGTCQREQRQRDGHGPDELREDVSRCVCDDMVSLFRIVDGRFKAERTHLSDTGTHFQIHLRPQSPIFDPGPISSPFPLPFDHRAPYGCSSMRPKSNNCPNPIGESCTSSAGVSQSMWFCCACRSEASPCRLFGKSK